MREAIGGSLLFYIMIGFIFIFIVFIAVIMDYASAYRASNAVLTQIERTEGNIKLGTSSDTADNNTLYGILKSRKYFNSLDVCCTKNSNGSIYKITTKVPFELPLIGVKLNLAINNETKTIYGTSCNTDYPGC